MMQDIADVLELLVLLYAAIGVMCIGFGYMVMGKAGGERAARFYFGRSLHWTFGHIRGLIAFLLGALRVIAVEWLLLPAGHYLLRFLRWFVTRERGWLRSR